MAIHVRALVATLVVIGGVAGPTTSLAGIQDCLADHAGRQLAEDSRTTDQNDLQAAAARQNQLPAEIDAALGRASDQAGDVLTLFDAVARQSVKVDAVCSVHRKRKPVTSRCMRARAQLARLQGRLDAAKAQLDDTLAHVQQLKDEFEDLPSELEHLRFLLKIDEDAIATFDAKIQADCPSP